ncbi:unnamed protein product [Paramecium pentaurelia]|uniref:Uncharacterized protein n=1 Tax=Paramecium pentaurelia TaxID=43138 RepID=A0A8S1W1D2_9CILI|nr:unnamed protein product [Paramecium pentaurelia]
MSQNFCIKNLQSKIFQQLFQTISQNKSKQSVLNYGYYVGRLWSRQNNDFKQVRRSTQVKFFWISILIQKQPLEYNIIHSQEIMLNFQQGILQDRKSTDPQCQAMKKKQKLRLWFMIVQMNHLFFLHIDKWIEEFVFQAGANVKIALIGHTQKLTEQYDIAYQIQINHQDLEFKDKMNKLLDNISISTESILFLYLGLIPLNQQDQSPISNLNLQDNNDQVNVIEFNHQKDQLIEVLASNNNQEVKSCEC